VTAAPVAPCTCSGWTSERTCRTRGRACGPRPGASLREILQVPFAQVAAVRVPELAYMYVAAI